ncbi:MurR/RpiR family transcriptional regulator [Martelella alba]|uniref:MurR/RpiR family transcriptional regulator n=1 Tax=Martelella alba TaxID=2590451 RepID=A0ABY2SH58_9HYPH|nr:MurR/RpiR family transcriptional regulator [Martelella alba]TKI03010.1 MurR/RpiR family transcriptional regulator [Martelella alba]
MTNTTKQFALLWDNIYTHYDDLGREWRKIAHYMLENPDSVALDSLAVIAERIDVPPSALIRFAGLFGFYDFNAMKLLFRKSALEGRLSYLRRAKLLGKISSEEEGQCTMTPGGILKTFTNRNAQTLEKLHLQISGGTLASALKLLNGAKKIYVAGCGRSFSIACYLTYAFLHVQRKVILIDGYGGIYTELLHIIEQNDVIISISFAPYAKETLQLVKLGVKKGIKQIVITDSRICSLAALSDVCFVISEANIDGFRSQSASMCLVQTLAVALATKKTQPNSALACKGKKETAIIDKP